MLLKCDCVLQLALECRRALCQLGEQILNKVLGLRKTRSDTDKRMVMVSLFLRDT